MTESVDWAFEQQPENAAAKLVLLTLAREGWECRLSQSEIAAETGLSLASVARSLRLLESSGLIRREAQHDDRGYRAPDRFALLHVTQPARQGDGQERSPSSEQHVTQPTRLTANQAHSQPGSLTGRANGSDLPTRHTAWQAERRDNKEHSPTESVLITQGGVGGGSRRAAPAREEHSSFAEWYSAYPVHKARGAAVKAYAKAVTKTAPAALLAAAKRYRDDEQVARGYGKHPATWLNQECWLDEPAHGTQPGEVVEVTGGWDV